MVPADVKPVSVTVTLLKFSTFTVVNPMVAVPIAEAREFSRLTVKYDKGELRKDAARSYVPVIREVGPGFGENSQSIVE
jgi:hypothetical protein